MPHPLQTLLARAETGPKEAVDELLSVAAEIEGERAPAYQPTEAERRAIDRFLRDADAHDFAAGHEVAAALENLRRA